MKRAILVGAAAVLTTLLVWAPFWLKLPSLGPWNLDFREGMMVIWRNFDGPNYLIIAKAGYNREAIRNAFSAPLPLEYYPAHLPFYPVVIKFFDFFLLGPWAMLAATLMGTFLAFGMFYWYLTEFKISRRALFLLALFLFLPARFLATRSVGSPEPWFIFFILASLFAFKKEKYLWAGIWGALAQVTKSPGVLLFAGYVIYLALTRFKNWRRAWPLLFIPGAALLVFAFYKIQTGDFWAYFNSGDNLHLFLPPFSIFTPRGRFWTGDFWLEEIIWLWLIYGAGVIRLWRKGFKIEGAVAATFFATSLFIAHRDVARYISPIAPLVLIGWKDLLLKREFKWLAVLLVLPALLFTWQFLLNNQAPIADWAPYL